MVYNINEECFKSNEFLELIKKRKNISSSNQNPICLAQKMKLNSQDTNFIFIDSTSQVTPNSNLTNVKGYGLNKKNEENIFTEISIHNRTNKDEIYELDENHIQTNVFINHNNEFENNTADIQDKDIVIEEGKVDKFFKCEKDIICNQSHNTEKYTDELHKVEIFKNDLLGNIEMITKENTMYNKKIPYTQKNIMKERKNDFNNDLKNTHKKREVTLDLNLNSYVFPSETKILDKSRANVFDSIYMNFLLQIYTQPTIQITDLSRHFYENRTFRNIKNKNFTNTTSITVQSSDKVRIKKIYSTIKVLDINKISILSITKDTAMKDICVFESYIDFGNYFYVERYEYVGYISDYRKKELLALPYYRENAGNNMEKENRTVISYSKINKNDAESNKITVNLGFSNEISIRKRDSGYFEEVLKNINSAFGFITRTVIKFCYCT